MIKKRKIYSTNGNLSRHNIKKILILSKHSYKNYNCFNIRNITYINRGLKGNIVLQHFSFNEPFHSYHKYQFAEVCYNNSNNAD